MMRTIRYKCDTKSTKWLFCLSTNSKYLLGCVLDEVRLVGGS